MEVVYELKSVCKAFDKHVVYQDMSLVISAGETLTVIGGSGMGKSVCLKLMLGLLHAESGAVLFKGDEVSALDYHRAARAAATRRDGLSGGRAL
jgi:phospholipid/cholesterol/gamma-HCH transport system ATP-binding protein